MIPDQTQLTPAVIPSPSTPQKTKQELYIELRAMVSVKRKKVAENNFGYFVQLYLPHLTTHKSPEFHKEMMRLLQGTIVINNNKPVVASRDPGTPIVSSDSQPPLETSIINPTELTNLVTRLLFIAPRGFAKSTICSVMFALWLICYKKRKDVFLVSATMSLAKELMRKVRKELETNETILEDFGDLKSDKWTEDILSCSNGVIARAKGRGFQIRGFRPDMIICDDLEDEEIIYSKDQRDKLEHWFFRTLLPALKPDQTLLYVGTKIHQYSLINKLQEKEEFTSRFYKALIDDHSIWEELWPTDRLQKLRKEIGEYAFQAEYQNNPISLADQPVKPHMLDDVKITVDAEHPFDAVVMAIDPAISEKTSADFRTVVLYGRNQYGFKEILSDRGRWGLDEQVDRMLDMYEKYDAEFKKNGGHGINRVVIEEVAFQKVFRQILLERGRARKLYLPVSPAALGMSKPGQPDKRPKDKFTRLMAVVHLFEQRLVEINNPELREELLGFPHGDHDDYVDATVYALYWLMHNASGKIIQKQEKQKVVDGKDSFVVKEVRPGVFIAEAGDVLPPPKVYKRFINFDKR